MKNSWYVATLIVRCRVGDQQDDFTCDEQVRVLRAPNAETAYEKAIMLGRQEEERYLNQYGETVYWEFLGLQDLAELDGTIRDGTEVRSRFLKHEESTKLVSAKEDLSVFVVLQTQRRIKREKSDTE